jgi:SAM-dependent methyltransferase
MSGSGELGVQLEGVQVDSLQEGGFPRGPRVYDYWLGGTRHFPIDQAVGEQVVAFLPEILDSARGNRRFLARAVGFLRDAGIRQFLDVGCGLPFSPNVHELAQQGGTGARVVYVDHDPAVTVHAAALTADNDATGVVLADLREAGAVLAGAAGLLDFTQPVALLFAGCLHHVPDSDDPAGVVARYLPALAPGSYLLISQITGEFAPDRMRVNTDLAGRSGTPLIPRGKDAIARMFHGHDLVDPGLVLVSQWRPDSAPPANGDLGPGADRVWVYGGVAAL